MQQLDALGQISFLGSEQSRPCPGLPNLMTTPPGAHLTLESRALDLVTVAVFRLGQPTLQQLPSGVLTTIFSLLNVQSEKVKSLGSVLGSEQCLGHASTHLLPECNLPLQSSLIPMYQELEQPIEHQDSTH